MHTNNTKNYVPIPSHWINEKYLWYVEKGIGFRFDEKFTLIEIEVLKTQQEQ